MCALLFWLEMMEHKNQKVNPLTISYSIELLTFSVIFHTPNYNISLEHFSIRLTFTHTSFSYLDSTN